MTWNGTTLTATNLAGGAGTFSGNVTVGGTFGATGAATFTSTISASAVSDTIGNVRILPLNTQTTSYTLQLSDSGKIVSTSGGDVIVPASIFSSGQTISIFNNNTTTMTITSGTGVTVTKAGTTSTGTRTLDANAFVTLVCLTSSTFVIAGAGLN
jgi:hypothetical protein